jgi:hypothetical protein
MPDRYAVVEAVSVLIGHYKRCVGTVDRIRFR